MLILNVITIYIFIIVTLFISSLLSYAIPPATIDVYYPEGFQVWIPADEGVTLFAFHGKLNEEFNGIEAGQWSADILRIRNGRYTFTDRKTRLKIGDVIYYWTFAIYDRLGYRQDNGEYHVNEYINSTINLQSKENISIRVDTNNIITEENCVRSSTLFQNKHPCQGQLIFEDDFNDLDTLKWQQERRFSGEPDNEFVIYLTIADNLNISNGILNIKPTRLENVYGEKFYEENLNLGEDCTGKVNTVDCVRMIKGMAKTILPPIISAQIKTINSFNFIYGKIEIKAKLPSDNWIFPQIFLESTNNYYGGNNLSSGQMRVAFKKGIENQIYGGILLDANEPFRSIKLCKNPLNKKWHHDFHVFSLEWKTDEIIMLVDDIEYCRIKNENGFHALEFNNARSAAAQLWDSKMAPFDKEFYLTLGIGVGGNNDFIDVARDINKPWKNHKSNAMYKFWQTMRSITEWPSSENSVMQIDYIRVYAL